MFQLKHGGNTRNFKRSRIPSHRETAKVRVRRLASLAGLWLLFSARPCGATTDYWNGSADTDWFNPANWSTTLTPTAADLAVVTSSPKDPTISGVLHPGSIAQMSSLYVGYSGSSALTILGGGGLSTTTVRIGSGGVGLVTLTGSGSTWTNTGTGATDFILGNSKSGTLTVNNAATLKVGNLGTGTIDLGFSATGAGVLNIGAAVGSLPVAPGSILAGIITTSAGTGTINFNHNSSGYTFGTQITGPTVVLQNGGFTILTGANTYTGGTHIVAGTLEAGSGSAVGAGSVAISGGTLNLGGANALALTLGSGANFLFGSGTLKLNLLSGVSYDHIAGNGGKLTLGGTLDLTGSNLSLGNYLLFSGFSGNSTGAFSSIIGYDASQFAVTFGLVSGVGTLYVSGISAVPEPPEVSVALSLFLGVVVVLRQRRRSAGNWEIPASPDLVLKSMP